MKTRFSPRNRSGKSVVGITRTAPATPWGAVTIPIVTQSGRALVDDLKVDQLVLARVGRFDHGTQRLRDAPPLADHLAHIRRRDRELQDDRLFAFDLTHAHLIRMIDEG